MIQQNLLLVAFGLVSFGVSADKPIVSDNHAPNPPSPQVDAAGLPTSNYQVHQWADLNYVMCEGVWGTGTGNVKVIIAVGQSGSVSTQINSIMVMSHYPHRNISTASVTYLNPSGKQHSVSLVQPWYPVLTPPNWQTLVLPRVLTDRFGRPSREGMEIDIKSGSSLVVKTTTMFPDAGSGCVASSSEEIVIRGQDQSGE